ncbi:hypothetical protein GCM10022393_29370 [Aquimarina addita]|uniref:Uncharacterized protein n=1 Tax=Aquimarina addita TaxID=870485 RepID=A0ABP6UNA9_9FLAO
MLHQLINGKSFSFYYFCNTSFRSKKRSIVIIGSVCILKSVNKQLPIALTIKGSGESTFLTHLILPQEIIHYL